MPTIPLSNSELLVEVSKEDHLSLILLGPWYLNGSGYAYTTGKPKFALHIVVAQRMGLTITSTVDHKDRNCLNSKRDNIQTATYTEQLVNRSIQRNNTTGYKCISWNKKARRFTVDVKRNSKQVRIGSYKTIEEALRQRDAYFKRNNIIFIE